MPDILAESLLMTSSSPHLRFLDLLADHSFFDPPPISAPFSIASLTTSQMALLCPASSWSTSAHFSPSQSPLWSHPKRLSALSALLLALLLLSPFLVTTWTHPKHSAMPCCQLAAEALAHCFPPPIQWPIWPHARNPAPNFWKVWSRFIFLLERAPN